MTNNDVCAIVVTFHPDPSVILNLQLLQCQVQGLVVVDNGSTGSEVSILQAACTQLGCMLIENPRNEGIAAALNTGLRCAVDEGYQWAALFDQDSTVTESFIELLLREYHSRATSEKIGMLVPRYVHRDSGVVIRPRYLKGDELEVARTSGTLLSTSVFCEQGPFLEGFFIDMVDYEFSLRIRTHGYKILECKQAKLVHSPGAILRHKFAGIWVTCLNYGASRRYYMGRNSIWLIREYWRTYPKFCFSLSVGLMKDLIKVGVIERNRTEKLKMMFLGLGHGFSGKLGPLAA